MFPTISDAPSPYEGTAVSSPGLASLPTRPTAGPMQPNVLHHGDNFDMLAATCPIASPPGMAADGNAISA